MLGKNMLLYSISLPTLIMTFLNYTKRGNTISKTKCNQKLNIKDLRLINIYDLISPPAKIGVIFDWHLLEILF